MLRLFAPTSHGGQQLLLPTLAVAHLLDHAHPAQAAQQHVGLANACAQQILLPPSAPLCQWQQAASARAGAALPHVRAVATASRSLLAQQWQDHQQQQHQAAADDDGQDAGQDAASIRQQLLDRALAHVPELGWSVAALHAAARQMGLSPAVVGMLPRRESELVEEFIRRCNRRLRGELEQRRQAGSLEPLSTRQRLGLALRIRLSMLEPHMDSWAQALAILGQPSNLPHGVALLHAVVDDVWALAGNDVSTDATWYTRRAALAGVYVASELYIMTDYSPGYEDTWQALERRLDDLDAMRTTLHEVQAAAMSAWQQAVSRARSAASAAASSSTADPKRAAATAAHGAAKAAASGG